MPMYTFHLCQPDGSSGSFEAFELIDDTAATVKAVGLLKAHPTADHVVGWDGARRVLRRRVEGIAVLATQEAAS